MRIHPYSPTNYIHFDISVFETKEINTDFSKIRFLGKIWGIEGFWMMNVNRNLVFVLGTDSNHGHLRDLGVNDCYRISNVDLLTTKRIDWVLDSTFGKSDKYTKYLEDKCVYIRHCSIKPL